MSCSGFFLCEKKPHSLVVIGIEIMESG